MMAQRLRCNAIQMFCVYWDIILIKINNVRHSSSYYCDFYNVLFFNLSQVGINKYCCYCSLYVYFRLIFFYFFLTLEIVTRTEKGGLSWPDWEFIHYH